MLHIKLNDVNGQEIDSYLIEKYAPNLKKHYEKYWNMMKDPNDGLNMPRIVQKAREI